jgi:hypothetical protein
LFLRLELIPVVEEWSSSFLARRRPDSRRLAVIEVHGEVPLGLLIL